MTLPANPVTGQERAALAVAAQGYTLAAGAKHLDVGKRTYQRLLSDAQRALYARNLIHAVAIAVALRIITVPLPGGNR